MGYIYCKECKYCFREDYSYKESEYFCLSPKIGGIWYSFYDKARRNVNCSDINRNNNCRHFINKSIIKRIFNKLTNKEIRNE